LLKEENIEKVQKGYQELGTRCQEVLKMFYYENLSIEEIKNRLNYTSKDVVKSQKSRCIKQLKEIVLKLR
jgi:DNA-directed RNA polymerase specialized sigma subunit